MKTERPVLRCFIAKPVVGGTGQVERSRLVSLGTAYVAHKAGWIVVGPDPCDEAALAAWEREQKKLFNPPRLGS